MPTDPTSMANTSAIFPPKQSPKRKRDNVPLSSPSKSSPIRASPLRVTTNASSLSQTPSKAPHVEDLRQSPRSRVANRFSDMEITPVSLSNGTATGGATIAPPRKLDFKVDHSPLQQAEGFPTGRRPKKQRTSLAIAKEIPETPGVREGVKEGVNRLSDPTNYIGEDSLGDDIDIELGNNTGKLWQDLYQLDSPTAKRKDSGRGKGFEESLRTKSIAEENGVDLYKKTPPGRSRTPPIPGGKAVWVDCGPHQPHLTKEQSLVDVLDDDKVPGTEVPKPLSIDMDEKTEERDELTEPASSLHWDDSEITGHDPSDPEDDGEGINGIGFRPTAAMARDRAERRRKQIEGWKSREDKEARAARAKRSEARRRAMLGEEKKSEEEEQARKVRFAEKERAMDVL